ncbi:hypothetical protein [Gorillibacterium sp. sgz5001074]|uniref:helix-turn-helix transcriptional regulator n=1 Tax=Gorillibacterium sp. sgz5001074 TaxID=3446695 RepID=UPI003F66EDE7
MGDLSALRENICAGCPGTMWGESARCRVHGCHIGHVTACYEWDHHEELEQKRSIDLASFLLQQMEADIKSYMWNQQKIQDLEEQLARMDGEIDGGPASSLVAKYGIEATLPPCTAPDEEDDDRYSLMVTRLRELRERVDRVDRAAAMITDPREQVVLQGLLQGLKMTDIALRAGVSKRTAERDRQIIIRKMVLGGDGSSIEFNITSPR